MRWIGRVLLALVVIVVVAAVAVPFLVPLEAYRAPIERAASAAIGRTVRIQGPMQISVYPDIGVSLQQVTVSNADVSSSLTSPSLNCRSV
ncbi:MAG: AsmA family protein [Planctomycetes bacterium]|nr:AsmA family protein [Planctomycetota bacterium]